MLIAGVELGFWADGCIRFMEGGHNLPRGPLGVLVYLPFAPIYWFLPASARTHYLNLTGLLLALLTVGPAYTITIATLAMLGYLVVRYLGPNGQSRAGATILVMAYGLLLIFPQPPWLPPVDVPLYFYLHWAGIGYLFLRSYHVLIDVGQRRMTAPPADVFFAFLLFPPTLRMGPLYRYRAFHQQLQADPAVHRHLGWAAVRFVTGFVRLGAMNLLIDHFPNHALYDTPEQLTFPEVMIHLYAAAMTIYLWISAYIDMSLGVGRVLGFDIPDNFNYPWIATSIDEFWRRWHITLGAWLKDYAFVPLVRRRWHYFAAFTATFLICGVWHGLYPSYIVWGLSQGVGMGARRWWNLRWKRDREANTPLYASLRRYRLVQSPANVGLAWLVTFHYQIVTISLFLDEQHTSARWLAHLARQLGLPV